MDDCLFRETFILQVLIFAQAIEKPVSLEQKNLFKLSKQETEAADKVSELAAKLLTTSGQGQTPQPANSNLLGKRTFGESLVHTVQKSEP